ncbi:hypothetical protein ElyMa_004046100 [Elysia marginata]|uniref:Uncharacterized protein n=1 Tax=Elysia marginata TaxID=1093978 RepID=A0AAV4G4L7_9GAST|nr:hypothetical protein ElyMa_004046100 [Elysia marginata]
MTAPAHAPGQILHGQSQDKNRTHGQESSLFVPTITRQKQNTRTRKLSVCPHTDKTKTEHTDKKALCLSLQSQDKNRTHGHESCLFVPKLTFLWSVLHWARVLPLTLSRMSQGLVTANQF